jgi:hypothetical protein
MSVMQNAFIVVLLLCANLVVGQSRVDDVSDLHLRITDNITSKVFKDSTALYTFNIHIKVAKRNNYVPIIRSTNEMLFKDIIPAGLLQNLNYKRLINKTENVVLIIPVSITVLDSKQGEKFINLSSLDTKIDSLFYAKNKGEEYADILYLAPVIVTIDNRVYN